MSGVQRFVSNKDNVLKESLIASSVRTAQAVFARPPTRTGNGRVRLIGNYSGHEDKTFDIEIVNDTGSTPRVSEPLFRGIGNGVLSGLSVDAGNPSQVYTVTLEDLGTDTVAAFLSLGAVGLEAIAAGAAGNDIRLTVDESGLVVGAATHATPAIWSAGTTKQIGEQWDFGAKPLNGDGTIPDDAPRLQIGAFARIHRMYSTFENNEFHYHLDPAPDYDIPEGTPIYPVSGARSVTISDGVTPEVYPNIVTLYDLLSAVEDTPSAHVKPRGVVAHDKFPNGMAIADLWLKTSAYHLPVRGDGSLHVTRSQPDNIQVAASAPSEVIELECTDASEPGGERWRVNGPASGVHTAFTGVPYTSSVLSFLIPDRTPATAPVGATLSVTDIRYASRGDEEITPPICVKGLAAGARAVNKTFTAVYTKVPPQADCGCSHLRPSLIDPNCLGVEPEEEAVTVAIDADFKSRALTLTGWLQVVEPANSEINSESGEVQVAPNDLALYRQIRDIFIKGLRRIIDNTAPASAERTAGLTAWDAALTSMQTKVTPLAGLGFQGNLAYSEWQNIATSISIGQGIIPNASSDNGHWYFAVQSGAIGVSEPTWPTNGTTVADGAAVWLDMGERSLAATNKDITLSGGSISDFVSQFQTDMDDAALEASIDPFDDANNSGSSCWREQDDAYHWVVEGLNHCPAYNNVRYYSCQFGEDEFGNRTIISTQEYTFQILVNEGCIEHLKEGDTVEFELSGGAGGAHSYQEGDRWLIPVVAASDKFLSGGVTGNDTHTWRVEGSIDGFVGNYNVIHQAEAPFNIGGLQFTIFRGAIAFALEDQFEFSAERGQFRWRVDGGAWQPNQDIPIAPVVLQDGLSAEFIAGTAPSFPISDFYPFDAEQPYAPSHALLPDEDIVQFQSVSPVSITKDLGVATDIQAVAIALHTIPASVTNIELGLGSTPAATDFTASLTWSAGPIVEILDAIQNYRYFRLTITGAPDASIGWLWAGLPIGLSKNSSRCDIDYSTIINRSNGINAAGLFAAEGVAGELEWDTRLRQDDINAVLALFQHAKQNDDEPFIFLPNLNHTDEAYVVRMGDQMRLPDRFRYEPSDKDKRLYSLSLPFEPYYS